MMILKVETFQEATTNFEGVITLKPDYLFTVMKFPYFWWFPFLPFYREYGVCTNLRPAEKVCIKKAVHLARNLNRKTKTRIMREVIINHKKTKDVIWQEGWLKARDLFPWWRTVFNWIFYPQTSDKPDKPDRKHAEEKQKDA